MIITPQEISLINTEGRIIGCSSGCYDLLHFHHLHYLERCRAQCDFLIIGVDSDELLTFFKKKDAVIPEYHRAAMVAALRCVDAVFIMRNLEQFRIVAEKSNKIFKNSPTLYGEPIVGAENKLVIIPDVEEVQSTSGIVKKIQERILTKH